LAVVVVFVIGVATFGLVRPGTVRGWLSAGEATSAPATASGTPDPAPTPVLAGATGGGVALNPARVKAALDPLVNARALGSTVHVAVIDPTTGEDLYDRDADVPTTPASTTKLLTAAAVLAARGPAYRLSTRAVAGTRPGEVVLVGGGDPTLSVDAKGLFPGAARLDQLAAQVKKALGSTKPTGVLVDTSLFSGPETGLGWDSDDISPLGQVARVQSLMTNGGRVQPVHNEGGGDPRFADPAIAAGRAFARLLGVPAGPVKRGKAPDSSAAASSSAVPGVAPGTQLGAVQSPPLVQITDWMLQESDNTIAETMGRQVALAGGKPATFDGSSDAVIAKLRELGLPADEADLYDSSGLSRHNGISPALLTQVLALAASGKQPALTGIFGGLPVAGWSGTLENRFGAKTDRAAEGVVRAKTGTLSGVNTMAGQLITKDGRLLVFAIMASGSSNATAAKAALDKIPARLVLCGC
jgi:D-alanyl-D-alanine carboxypeptidase/D-alanyl-D-alanine-endopeptidase (penicillin-binding protein 4)